MPDIFTLLLHAIITFILWFANIHRTAKESKPKIAKSCRSGFARPSHVFVLAICPCGFRFELSNPTAHFRDFLLQSLLGREQRTEQVPTLAKHVCNQVQ